MKIMVAVLVAGILLAGCGGSPSVVGKTYKRTLDDGSNIIMTFETTNVTQFINLNPYCPPTATYPYSLTGDTVTIYLPLSGESEDMKLTDGGKVLTGSGNTVYHRE